MSATFCSDIFKVGRAVQNSLINSVGGINSTSVDILKTFQYNSLCSSSLERGCSNPTFKIKANAINPISSSFFRNATSILTGKKNQHSLLSSNKTCS